MACAALLLAGAFSAIAAAGDCAPRENAPAALHVVVVVAGEEDPGTARGIRDLGANAVATLARPSVAASAAAHGAGLAYIPFLSTRDVERLATDPEYLLEIRAVPGIAGFQYRDEDVLEGYTSPASQERAYTVLKSLFPGALVLCATRLDPVQTDPKYLDGFFRPQFSDYVTTYFYPVGGTVLGPEQMDDRWEDRLASLLTPIRERTPAGKPVLPVLQAFEQSGYPVTGALLQRQIGVYRRLWPDSRDIAEFSWDGPAAEGLAALAETPALQGALRNLFRGGPARAMPCHLPERERLPF